MLSVSKGKWMNDDVKTDDIGDIEDTMAETFLLLYDELPSGTNRNDQRLNLRILFGTMGHVLKLLCLARKSGFKLNILNKI